MHSVIYFKCCDFNTSTRFAIIFSIVSCQDFFSSPVCVYCRPVKTPRFHFLHIMKHLVDGNKMCGIWGLTFDGTIESIILLMLQTKACKKQLIWQKRKFDEIIGTQLNRSFRTRRFLKDTLKNVNICFPSIFHFYSSYLHTKLVRYCWNTTYKEEVLVS